MARRAQSPSKRQTDEQASPPATMPEVVEPKGPRRGRPPKSTTPRQAEPSLTDAFFPGGDESTEIAADTGPIPPAEPRRGRKPKTPPSGALPPVSDPAADETTTSFDVGPSSGDPEQSELQVDGDATPPEAPPEAQGDGRSATGMAATATATASVSPPAAQWDVDSGLATFDWPTIEQVATTDGPNQAMAKLLLAARAEGANSRWPF